MMDAKTFLTKALSSEGMYCTVAVHNKRVKAQKFYGDIESVIGAVDNFVDNGYDAYFALATFEAHEDNTIHRRLPYIKHLNSLFLDLDCGPTKEFPNQREAIKKLREFCTEYNLPKPVLVNSGFGIHVYWFLSEPVSYEVWYPVAEKLKRRCLDNKFFADPVVTSDGTRILRVPNTLNHKADPPVPVELLGEYDELPTIEFQAFSDKLGNDLIPVPTYNDAQEYSQTMQNLLGNTESVFKDIIIKTVKGAGCPQLGHIIKEQATMSEPMWRAGLSIAKFCTDVEKAAHTISHKHPEYSEQQTQKKLAQIKGPYTCSKFDEFRPDVCPNCPNWGRVKSPIMLGKRLCEAEVDGDGNYVVAPAASLANAPTQVYQIPKYPFPYLRGKHGGIYVKGDEDENGIAEEVEVYSNDFYIVKRVEDPEDGYTMVARLHLPQDGVKEFTLPYTAIGSKEEFRKTVSAKGIMTRKMEQLMSYTMTWEKELSAKIAADKAHRQFGWTDSTMKEFIIGNRKVTASSVEFNPPTSATVSLFPYFEPSGTIEAWKDNLKLWEGDRFTLQQFAFGMGFGSPLMEFFNTRCGTVAFYSKESGLGKTGLMYAAAGIWGDPSKLLMYEKDTMNYKMHRTEVLHSLPACIDEVTNMNPYELSEMIYQSTSGSQKGRMTANANVERYQGLPWSLLTMMTSNTSVVERILTIKSSAAAEAQRVLECRVHRIFDATRDKELTDNFEKGLLSQYGHAGEPYIQYVIRNLEQCRKICLDVQKQVDKKANLTAENRFWSAIIAATVSGLIIAKKAGLHDFEPAKVFAWAIRELIPQNQNTVRSMEISSMDMLIDFFNEHLEGIIRIKSHVDRRIDHNNGMDQHIVADKMARGKLIGRYEPDTKLFFISTAPLRKWCGENQINYEQFISDAKQIGGKLGKKRLGKGTSMNIPAANVLIVPFEVPNEDDETEA
jgi:hypothetical protein